MFQKGNKGGPGRPKVSLNKPELLLPIIFQKAKINWAEDFTKLYRWYKNTLKPDTKSPTYLEYMSKKSQFDMYLELLPYLCTKVAVKDLDFSKWHTQEDKEVMNKQTEDLIRALENGTIEPGKEGRMEGGSSSVPPKA